MINEFKDFIAKGNVMDMAVGIIIGAAFTAIVGSLVADIINPIIGLFMGGVDFAGLSASVGEATFTYGDHQLPDHRICCVHAGSRREQSKRPRASG